MLLSFPATGFTVMCTCSPNFDVGAGDLNTGPHVCTAARAFSPTPFLPVSFGSSDGDYGFLSFLGTGDFEVRFLSLAPRRYIR